MLRFVCLCCLAGLLSLPTLAQRKKKPASSPKTTTPTQKQVPAAVSPPGGRPTYCNPLNLDYGYTPIPDFTAAGRHRATADPVITLFKDDYYLFSTNQGGYWWSHDLSKWTFVARSFLKPEHKTFDDLCAPAVFVLGDTLVVYGSTHEKNFPIWMSTNPKAGAWQERISAFQVGAWDPAFFLDEDDKLYLYWGSSNKTPIYGQQINRHTFRPLGRPKKLIALDDRRYGWQRFGEYLDNTALDPFLEGAWMTKHAGKYYLQYGAPGTEFSGYADGVQVGNGPLGPFRPQAHNPFSYKPGGFARGAGHGNTFQDRWGSWWHTSTMVVSVKNNFERRLGLWPAAFDPDGVLYANTAFGDYPHYLPAGLSDYGQSLFTGWMLLNYNKPVQVSSTLGGYAANHAVDENIKTYWSAASGRPGEFIQTDLGRVSTVHAVQINYADQDAIVLGKPAGAYHQYRLLHSLDGKKWQVLADKSQNTTDVPHDYVELRAAVRARYLKLENRHMPTGKFAISGLRVFGRGGGSPPEKVKNLTVLRTRKDKRGAWLKWPAVDGAYAYNIYTGSTFDKLYSCIMVHGANEYYFKGMDKNQTYYFTIEAVNENGVSPQTIVQEAR
ncbi:family 43 glycosylhydrolase [Hymenobacter sp.]|uniref:family 43 glycosylhydrolase n=1 Tax=Hymenobacter sp. TaxID=1898978 RepID=UPI00286A0C0F|nr:family 43 glycosylhydrolase [Hymenobacter sp.]